MSFRPEVLDNVMISAAVYAQWAEVARAFAKDIPRGTEVPDEQAEVLPSGELRIYVEAAGRKASLVVPASEWAWRA